MNPELRELIERHATADGAPIATEVVEAVRAAGLYGALTPKDAGGLELSLLENLDLMADIAYADGSTGWCFMACATTSAFFGAWAGDDSVLDAYANGVPLAAGQLAPMARPSQSTAASA